MIKLEEPSVELFPAYREFVLEMLARGETVWNPYTPSENENPAEFVERILRRKENPEPPLVAETVYWPIFDGSVVGRISLRHTLNDNLRKMGGHIGYEVRPSFRRRGFATEMLRQILLTPKAREIGDLMLTCAPDNIASNRTILANGGILTQTIYVESIGADRNHYWIRLR